MPYNSRDAKIGRASRVRSAGVPRQIGSPDSVFQIPLTNYNVASMRAERSYDWSLYNARRRMNSGEMARSHCAQTVEC